MQFCKNNLFTKLPHSNKIESINLSVDHKDTMKEVLLQQEKKHCEALNGFSEINTQ